MGALVARRKESCSKRIAVTIRLPEELVAQIDLACDQRQIPTSRNNWLLEAAVEKLERRRARETNG
jgi:metal-responsive CopG/Arc/MetJ family transcriptional regulator